MLTGNLGWTVLTFFWMADVSTEEAKEGNTADAVALVHLFVDWLPREIATKRSSG